MSVLRVYFWLPRRAVWAMAVLPRWLGRRVRRAGKLIFSDLFWLQDYVPIANSALTQLWP